MLLECVNCVMNKNEIGFQNDKLVNIKQFLKIINMVLILNSIERKFVFSVNFRFVMYCNICQVHNK